MDYKEIEDAALALDRDLRIELADALVASVRKDLRNGIDARTIVAQVEAAAGCDIETPGRQPRKVAMRCVIAYRLRDELKMTYCEIGGVLHRDHATVGYYIDRMREARKVPAMWPEYIELYNKSKLI